MNNTPREDVIRMAREAGFAVGIGSPALPKFTHLIQLVKAEEREACAKVCECQADRFMQASPLEGNKPYASNECAAAIRAKSNT